MSLMEEWSSQQDDYMNPSPPMSLKLPQGLVNTMSSTITSTKSTEDVLEQPKFRLTKLAIAPRQDSEQVKVFTCGSVYNNIILLGTNSNHIIRWNIQTDEKTEIQISPRATDTVTLISQYGYHSLIVMSSGSVYYYTPIPRAKPTLLSKFKNTQAVITCIHWYNTSVTSNPHLGGGGSSGSSGSGGSSSSSSSSGGHNTARCLIGTQSGEILDLTIEDGKDRSCKLLFSLGASSSETGACSITGIHIQQIDPLSKSTPNAMSNSNSVSASGSGSSGSAGAGSASMSNSNSSKASHIQPNVSFAIIVTTQSRLYQFIGNSTVEAVLSKYTANPSYIELPGNSDNSTLKCAPTNELTELNTQLAWLTVAGIYHGMLNTVCTNESILCEPMLIDIPAFKDEEEISRRVHAGVGVGNVDSIVSVPKDICPTAYHVLVGFANSIVGINTLTYDIDDQIVISQDYGKLVCFLYDTSASRYYALTTHTLLDINVDNERNNLWKLLVTKKAFQQALNFTSRPDEIASIKLAMSHDLFERGSYLAAAETYTVSEVSAERLILRYIDTLNEKVQFVHSILANIKYVIHSNQKNNNNNNTNSTTSKGKSIDNTSKPVFTNSALTVKINQAHDTILHVNELKKSLRHIASYLLNVCNDDIYKTTQRALLGSFITEIFCSALHFYRLLLRQLELYSKHSDVNDVRACERLTVLLSELLILERDEFYIFLEDYYDCLHTSSTLQLMSYFGCHEERLFFAKTIGDIPLLVDVALLKRDYDGVLEALIEIRKKLKYSNTNVIPAKDCELIFRTLPSIIQPRTKETIEFLSTLPQLDIQRILYILTEACYLASSSLSPIKEHLSPTEYQQALTKELSQPNYTSNFYLSDTKEDGTKLDAQDMQKRLETNTIILQYLRNIIEKSTPQNPALPGVHNLYITLLARMSHIDALLAYVKNPNYADCYDYLFLLRLCSHEGDVLLPVAIAVYRSKHLYVEAVLLAIKFDPELAKTILQEEAYNFKDKPLLLRNLWLNYTERCIAEGQSVSTVIRTVATHYNSISLSNLLECLPGITYMNDIREEVLRSIETHTNDVADAKQEMHELTVSCEKIKAAITDYQKTFGTVTSDQCCDLCNKPILIHEFLYFACTHAMHVHCAIQSALEYLQLDSLRKQRIFTNMYEQYEGLLKKNNIVYPSSEAEQLFIEEFAQQECHLCGTIKIHSITDPFIQHDEEEEIAMWSVDAVKKTKTR